MVKRKKRVTNQKTEEKEVKFEGEVKRGNFRKTILDKNKELPKGLYVGKCSRCEEDIYERMDQFRINNPPLLFCSIECNRKYNTAEQARRMSQIRKRNQTRQEQAENRKKEAIGLNIPTQVPGASTPR